MSKCDSSEGGHTPKFGEGAFERFEEVRESDGGKLAEGRQESWLEQNRRAVKDVKNTHKIYLREKRQCQRKERNGGRENRTTNSPEHSRPEVLRLPSRRPADHYRKPWKEMVTEKKER